MVQKTSRKNVTTTVLISSFLSFWWSSWVEKSQSAEKNCTKIEKEETHANRKRARGALSRERTLELRQWCTTSRECSFLLDKWIVLKITVAKRTLLYLKYINFLYNWAHTHIYNSCCAMNQLYKNTGTYHHWVDWCSWCVALTRMLSECTFKLSWRVCLVLTRYENLLITLSFKRIFCLTGLHSVLFFSWPRWWMMTRLINYYIIRKWNGSSGDWIQRKSRHKHNQE